MALQESGEMYLESILVLSKELENVRSLDIANHMNFSKPSVSRAVGILKSAGYIDVNQAGYITLTNKGLEIATKIFERHNVITSVLEKLGVPHEVAEEDACRIEHVISDETFTKLKEHISQ